MKRVLLTLLLIQGLAVAAETKVDKGIKMPYMDFPMKPGKGMYSTKGKCNMCHSWGYTINQGLQSKKFWRKKVAKMITVFHAPIKNEDIEEVVEYLYTNYGNGKEE